MSGKKERRLRQALRGHKFPVLTEKQLQEAKPVRVDQIMRTGPDVAINHGRRIKTLISTQNLLIDEAIKRHCKQLGIKLKPVAAGP